MERNYIKYGVILWMAVCLLSGCAGSKKKEAAMKPMESKMTVEEFEVTLLTEKVEYKRAEIKKKKAPFDYKLLLKYTGQEEQVSIWHTSSIGGISLLNPEGECIVENLYFSIAESSILEKDVFITIDEWDGSREIEKLEELKPGVYMVRAYVSFDVGENFDDRENLESIEGSFYLPLIIQ